MKHKYLLLPLLLSIFFAIPAFCDEVMPYMSYNIAFPSGDLEDFISEESYSGFEMGLRKYVNEDITVGFSIGWNFFDEKITELEEIEDGHVYGTQIRYVDTIPILLNGHYYFPLSSEIKPYVGLSAGAYYVTERWDIGILSVNDQHWHFGLAPEVGIMFSISSVDLMATVRYNYAFKSQGGDTAKDYTYWGLNLGMMFPQ